MPDGTDNDGGSYAPAVPSGWDVVVQPIQGFWCGWWNVQTQKWEHIAGSGFIWMVFRPARFYGPSRRTASVAQSDPSPMDFTASDPRYATARGAVPDALAAYGSDYTEWLEWLDHALGGHWHAPDETALYGDGNPGAPHLKHVFCGDPVNCATGNFTERYQDTSVGGPGVTLSQGRTYNSQAAAASATPGPFGHGWTATFRDHLEIDAADHEVVVHQDNGSTVRFTQDPDGDYGADDYVQSTLAGLPGGGYRYRLPDRTSYDFDAIGRLVVVADHAGNQTSLTYSSGRLATVTDPVGRTLTYSYNNDGLVDVVTDPAGHSVHYAYTDGDLTTVTDVGGQETSFGYDDEHQITSVTDPRGHIVTRNVYDDAHRVTSQRDALDHETTWAYGADDGDTTTEVTDPSGSVTRMRFTDRLPVKVVAAAGTSVEAVTEYTYDRLLQPDQEGRPRRPGVDVRVQPQRRPHQGHRPVGPLDRVRLRRPAPDHEDDRARRQGHRGVLRRAGQPGRRHRDRARQREPPQPRVRLQRARPGHVGGRVGARQPGVRLRLRRVRERHLHRDADPPTPRRRPMTPTGSP